MTSKVWFITGASRGFGYQWTLAALRRGDRVAAAARDISSLGEVLTRYPEQLMPLSLDVADRDADCAAIKTAHEYFGRLDVVVNNAGYGQSGFVEELTPREARAQMDVNFFGALWITQAALPIMRKQRRGHIIQVSSSAGVISAPDLGIYCASKFALEGLAAALAFEVQPFGVHVTIVEPGMHATGFLTAGSRSAELPEYADVRVAATQELAKLTGAPHDPAVTVSQLLALVDAPEPPLRALLGPGVMKLVRSVYEQRLRDWEQWDQIVGNGPELLAFTDRSIASDQ